MPLPRLLILAAAFGLMLWFFLKANPDQPATHRATGSVETSDPVEPTDTEHWTQEDWAVWRAQVDRRLHR
jgi:hypothetical protein